MRTIDEIIKWNEEVAEAAEQIYKDWKDFSPQLKSIDDCSESAKEHRQVAKWLRELKTYKNTLIDRPCSACKFKKDNGCCKWACVFEGSENE